MPVRQLSEAIVNRIAAGEVVERPASVVKELVENALDAGASRIDVFTDGGGRRLIRVTDDGEGMTRADLALAVERHATSKLADDDLVSIRTLGFRGEALPSIGAVARLSIATRHAGEPHAWAIEVDAGAKSELKPAALGQGTRVEVRDLFYATPARLKFLKLDRTEAEAVREVVRRLAMSRPDVAFTLAGEERAPVTFAATLPGATGGWRGSATCSAPIFAPMPSRSPPSAKACAIEGFAALPTLTRANALGQYLFVNGRPVRDKLLIGAVRGAYADYLPRDRHPLLALFVTLDAREVDVNVHPAKAEVRFRNAGLVRALIVHALKAALAREGTRAATTGGAATIAAFRRVAAARLGLAALAGAAQRSRGRAFRGAAPRRFRRSGAGSLRRRRAGGRLAPIACRCRRRLEPAAELLDHPLGAARAQVHETYIVVADPRRPGHRRPARRARAHRLREAQGRESSKTGVARQILLIPDIVELDEADVERLVGARRRTRALRPGARSLRPRRGGAARNAGAARRDRRRRAGARSRRAHRRMGRDVAAGTRLMQVASSMACHGSVRAGRRLQAGGDERAVARDGSDAEFRPVQSRPADLCGVQAHRHRAIVRAALTTQAERDMKFESLAISCRIGIAAVPAGACAQDWPTRPITLVVPFARRAAASMSAPASRRSGISELLGQPIVVENMGAAAGMAGAPACRQSATRRLHDADRQ